MTIEGSLSTEFKYCDCGCGFTLARYKYHHGQWRERKYIHNHHWRGKKRNTANKGDKHHNWKGNNGDNLTPRGLHQWVRYNFPPPELCQLCFNVPPTDLANLTGIRNRDFNNWIYLCEICHNRLDHNYN